jgi:outer membrane lipoprotein carrier protein
MFWGMLWLSGPADATSPWTPAEILRKTETYYQQLPACTATFKQWTTSSAVNAMTTEASGKLYYQKPRQMRWEYEAPDQQVFVANQQLAWLYVPAENQIALLDGKAFFTSPLAQTFFDGAANLRNHYEVKLDSIQSTDATAVLRLKPNQEDPNIRQMAMWIDMKLFQIIRIETLDAMGNTNRIELQKQTSVPQLDKELFQLPLNPTVAVLDADGRELTTVEIQKLKNTLK